MAEKNDLASAYRRLKSQYQNTETCSENNP